MSIELKNVIPIPLEEIEHSDSEVWEMDSLIFKSGERILLYATSGKGKTSLLSMIYGLRKDFKGDILFDNQNIRTTSERKISYLRKNKLSYIFQGLELFDDLTAMDNIQLKNRQTNFKNREELIHFAQRLEIYDFLNRKTGLLSFGQKQRVAIIRGLCQPMEYLLADEIFSHLDDETQSKAFDLIAEECDRQGAGLLFTSLRDSKLNNFTSKYRV